eukprot:GEMP01071955.1.p1 GENE.GEMP01071955.1~~GEMP01071955.1.p1  ORF type:complete len:118 (+),score=41.94 GEMP01071955.1:173-526(+)
MPVDITVSGAIGLKAIAAAQAAVAAAKESAAQGIAMAQNANLAAAMSEQAQADLEKYVYGVPMSSVPPSVSPMPPAAIAPLAQAGIVPELLLFNLSLPGGAQRKTLREKPAGAVNFF